MCKLVTVIHPKESLFENKVIKRLSERRAEKNDTVAIVNYGEGSVVMNLEKYDIIDYQGEIDKLKELKYNSVFAHLPISKIGAYKSLLAVSDLIVLSSLSPVVNLNDFNLNGFDFKSKKIIERTTIVFQEK